MPSLEADLERARELDVGDLADAVQSIGFECTRCGACCTAHETASGEREPHTATVFPDEIRRLTGAETDAAGEVGSGGDDGEDGDVDEGGEADRSGGDGDGGGDAGESEGPDRSGGDESLDWRDVARPMPFGLREGSNGPEGETFEWALQVDDCGDCVFYAEEDGVGACTRHDDRPLICRTYPFSVALPGTSQPMGEPVDEEGVVRAHECEGLGRDIDREDAEELARTLKARAVRELEEAIAVRENYEPASPDPGSVVVHDSEGAKRPDGAPYEG
ncbi:MAG: YkgJ family cysteine cluster protein [Haloferacaceae archaeon]